mgnify:CR=1 FL=1
MINYYGGSIPRITIENHNIKAEKHQIKTHSDNNFVWRELYDRKSFDFFIFSAAKAPYLARFKVEHVGLSGLEVLGASSTIPQFVNETKQSWQSCIFKVGDDVRQVIHLCLENW